MSILNMEIGSSLRFAILLLLLHLITAIVVYDTVMPAAAKAVVLALILSSLAYCLARDVLRLFACSWTRISLDGEGVSIVTRDRRSFSGQVEMKTVVWPSFIVLCIKPENCRRPVFRVIFPDALGDGAFRELCVRLRFA